MLPPIKADDVPVSNISKEFVVAIGGFDDRKFVELTFSEELECADQVVVRTQGDGASVDEVVGQQQLAHMLELFSISKIVERQQPREFTQVVLQEQVAFAGLAREGFDLCER